MWFLNAEAVLQTRSIFTDPDFLLITKTGFGFLPKKCFCEHLKHFRWTDLHTLTHTWSTCCVYVCMCCMRAAFRLHNTQRRLCIIQLLCCHVRQVILDPWGSLNDGIKKVRGYSDDGFHFGCLSSSHLVSCMRKTLVTEYIFTKRGKIQLLLTLPAPEITHGNWPIGKSTDLGAHTVQNIHLRKRY